MLKSKHLAVVLVALFFLSLIFSSIIVQVATGVLTETRKSVLIKTLSEMQLDNGSFGYPGLWNPYLEVTTACILIVFETLNALNRIDINKVTEYLVSQQDPVSGGFGKIIDEQGTFLGFDLYVTYLVVRVLKFLDALDKINRTALVNFVLARYNWSDGGFHELTVEAYGKEWSFSLFPIETRIFGTEYAQSNIISTFFGVSILSDLGELNKINVTKTFNFVLNCRRRNGAFAPSPSVFKPLDSFFYVDGNGTGIPYTYAAIGALKVMGHIDILSREDREKILEYLKACQFKNKNVKGLYGSFAIHKGVENWEHTSPNIHYTYQAIITLYYLSLLDKAKELVSKAINYVLDQQFLDCDDSWPVPRGREYWKELHNRDVYGLFYSPISDIEGTYHSIMILNVTNNLHLLNEFTPRAKITIINLIFLTTIICIVVFLSLSAYYKHVSFTRLSVFFIISFSVALICQKLYRLSLSITITIVTIILIFFSVKVLNAQKYR